MLTPVDVQNKVFKGGIGFDKKDVEAFMKELSADYETLYRSNVELKDKVATLNESLQHYRSIEDSMQKALTISEKTAEETVSEANEKARQISVEAEKKAESIVAEAKEELTELKSEIARLQQHHAKYKEQFVQALKAQLAIVDEEMEDIDFGEEFERMAQTSSDFGFFSNGLSGLNSEFGTLGSGLSGTSAFDDRFERANQEPTINRGSLNMDPFADAVGSEGRFSKQTKKADAGSTKKSSLNVKDAAASKVKKNFTTDGEKKDAVNAASETKVTPEQKIPDSTNAVHNTVNTETMSHSNKEESQVTGEVENHVNKSVMLDDQEQYEEGFHFVSDEDTAETVSGEVENRVNNVNILDSEDNYSEGFDFIVDDLSEVSLDEDTYTGEVEDRVNNANILDSEDNYSEGFDFVVGGEDAEEKIPPIFSESYK